MLRPQKPCLWQVFPLQRLFFAFFQVFFGTLDILGALQKLQLILILFEVFLIRVIISF